MTRRSLVPGAGRSLPGTRRFGVYLRALREGRRLTLEDVERATLQDAEPVTRSQLSRLEHGQARVSAQVLVALARLYRVRVGLLAERLELDGELEQIAHEGAANWSVAELLGAARQAGHAGQVSRALLLYEQAEMRSLRGDDEIPVRNRARIGVSRALAAAGRYRSARAVLEDMLGERLGQDERAWVFFSMAKTSLALGQALMARAAHLSLQEVPRPWPLEIESAAPTIEGEYLLFENRLEQAFETYIAALDAARRGFERPTEVQCLFRLAEIARRQNRTEPALDWIARARDLARVHGLGLWVVQAETEEGRILAARRRFGDARQAWSRARHLARQLDLSPELFEIYVELWRLARREGDRDQARAALRSLRHLARLIETIPPHAADVVPHLDGAADANFPAAGPRSGQPRIDRSISNE